MDNIEISVFPDKIWDSQKDKRLITPTPEIKKLNNTWAKIFSEQALQNTSEQTFQPNIIPEETTINNNDIQAEEQTSTIRKTTKSVIKKTNINNQNKQNPGIWSNHRKIVKELPNKTIKFIRILFNTIFRIHYSPSTWKLAKIKLPKPEKNIHEPSISFLPLLSKMLEKILELKK